MNVLPPVLYGFPSFHGVFNVVHPKSCMCFHSRVSVCKTINWESLSGKVILDYLPPKYEPALLQMCSAEINFFF